MIWSDLDQKLCTYDHSTVSSTIASQFQIHCGMLPKSVLGVEMVTNRDLNLQYVVQPSYLESTPTPCMISSRLSWLKKLLKVI